MYEVLLFYKYVTLTDPAQEASRVRALAEASSLTGRVIVATEGINGTLEGTPENTQRFSTALLQNSAYTGMDIKRSRGTGNAFRKLSVKVRPEIVGTRYPKDMADPEQKTAPHLPAEELHAWYARGEDFVVVDMRNGYEYASGHFRNSIDPGMQASRELPDVLPALLPYKDKKVVTVCTGGVRCEKMSAYLMNSGFTDVYQLENGIHTYMERYPGEDFLGTLYTFDGRVVMDFGGENRTVVGKCALCAAPTETYTNCARAECHAHILICSGCTEKTGHYCSKDCAPLGL